MHEKCSILKSIPTKTSGSTVTHLQPPDPTAEMYRKVRDIIICSDGVSNAERVSILELLKAELIRGIQAELDEE